MKLLIHSDSKVVVRIINDSDLVDVEENKTEIYGSERETILDLMSSNAEVVVTTVTQPEGWVTNAYKINQADGEDDTWVVNSDYVAPED
jgi:hypothetical protein